MSRAFLVGDYCIGKYVTRQVPYRHVWWTDDTGGLEGVRCLSRAGPILTLNLKCQAVAASADRVGRARANHQQVFVFCIFFYSISGSKLSASAY